MELGRNSIGAPYLLNREITPWCIMKWPGRKAKALTIGALITLIFIAAGSISAWRLAIPRPTHNPRETSIPVTTIRAEQTSVPVYLQSLGTVQSLNTVLVRSRVDGPIVKVAFTEGQMVQAGDLLVQIDPRPFQAQYDQAAAKKTQDEANLQNVILDLQRTTELAERGNATRQQRDTQAAQVEQLKALIQADQAAIESAQLNVEFSSVRAPIAGRVSFSQITLGNVVHTTDTTPIVTINQLQPISVIFTAPEDRLSEIVHASGSQQLETIAITSDGSRVLSHGSLAVVNNQVDASSGTVQLKAVFENKDNALWPGQAVNIRLLVHTMDNSIVVSDSALQRGPGGFFVYVVDARSKARRRGVKIGPMADGRVVIAEGLAEGEQVVTDGQYRLDNDVRVAATDQTPGAGRAAAEERSVGSATNWQSHPSED